MSIFKKLAFVLALAMIVTLVPAKSAKAAATSVSKSSTSICRRQLRWLPGIKVC